jgi:putative membrane protein insertion efficiency factor
MNATALKRGAMFVVLAPRNLCVAILTAYRTVISPLYGDVCRYYPSCSHYAMQAIQQHGVVRGVWFGTRRIARCHPWAEGGVDDVPAHARPWYSITRFGFAVPAIGTTHGHGKG